jgi:type IV pilus assembly protein PilY1
MKKNLILFVVLAFFLGLPNASALDTDLYVVTSLEVKPNILIMFDNSGSMNDSVSGVIYSSLVTYPYVVTEYPNRVYYRTTGGNWNVYRNDINGIDGEPGILCPAVKAALMNEGFFTGKIKFSTSDCGTSNNVNLRTGNYMNYMQLTGGPETQPKLGLAKGIIQSFVNTTDGVRFGAMIFNSSEGGRLLREIRDMDGNNRADLHSAIGGLQADTWTPLAETLYEAGLYFKGANSYFNPGTKYTSPVQYYCQRNYVIVITDGEPTKDRNAILQTLPNNGDTNLDGRENPDDPRYAYYADEGSDYLDDVAKYLHDSDLRSDLEKSQNVTTYTIGFTVNSPLLERTANNAGGKFFYCHNAQSFIIAFQMIIDDILSKSTSYVAPVVPISQMERTSAGDRMYLAMFKPTMKSFWKGNIKKYGIVTQPSGDKRVGDILDATNTLAMDAENKIKDSAKSFWSSKADGGEVELGGVGEVLRNRDFSSDPRKIYTYMQTNVNLTDPSNRFALSNTAITPAKLGLAPNDDAGRNSLINFIHGLDAYDENGNWIRSEKRDWILGAFIHSRPFVLHYGTDESVIFAGGNDGMLHAFDDASGKELWAFIPPDLLPNLRNLNGETIEFFVDGSPRVHVQRDYDGNLLKAILIFGLRRGGDRYTALDITNRESPTFLWQIGPSTPGYGELGQSWSTPQIGKIESASDPKGRSVVFISGGYDPNQDNLPATALDSRGRAIYVVDIHTGSLIWSYSYAKNAEMKYSIPSDIARVDTDGNSKIDRLYVGDIGGRVWRFDIGNADVTKWTAKNIFNSNPGTSDKRKIFYPPDVTLENDSGDYEMLFLGTGDREHPKTTNNVNRLYAVKDKFKVEGGVYTPATVLTETDMVDVTLDLLQDPSTSDATRTSIQDSLRTKSGWYIVLNEFNGEKVLSSPVIFYGIAYYTTFTPTFGSETDVCYLGEGTGRMYALRYKTGNAAFNLDGSLDGAITRSDRAEVIGTSIPSGVIVTFIGGTATAYVGVGGGVGRPPLPETRRVRPVNWRILF